MRSLLVFLFIQTFSTLAFAQYPYPRGMLKVAVMPPVLKVGDSVLVEIGVFSPGLCPYQSTYEIEKDSSGAGLFQVIVHSDSTGGKCASAFGFSGPSLHVVPDQPGTYHVRFASTSPFQPDTGDLALFRVLPAAPVSATSASEARPAGETPLRREAWHGRVDGRSLRSSRGLRRP